MSFGFTHTVLAHLPCLENQSGATPPAMTVDYDVMSCIESLIERIHRVENNFVEIRVLLWIGFVDQIHLSVITVVREQVSGATQRDHGMVRRCGGCSQQISGVQPLSHSLKTYGPLGIEIGDRQTWLLDTGNVEPSHRVSQLFVAHMTLDRRCRSCFCQIELNHYTLSVSSPKKSDYPIFGVTCDIVIFTIVDKEPHVLLVERGGDPFVGMWALPGGFKHPDETLDEAARRELLEETNVEAPTYLRQFRAYGDPGRDPRQNVVTVAYVAVVSEVVSIRSGTDAADAGLHPVDDVLAGKFPLAFDHSEIVSDAFDWVAEQLEVSDIATSFVPKEFSLSELRSVYEGFWGDELDGANFRRNLLTEQVSFVKSTGILGDSTSSGGRPPELFKATKAWREVGPPIRRKRRR